MKLMKSTIAIVSAIIISIACTSDPKGDEAKVSNAEEVTASEGMTVNLNSNNTNMEFVGTKPTGRHYGNIAMSEGMVKINDGKVTGGKFIFDLNEITITDLKDSQESHDKLVGHLKSDDFFDAANYPNVTFELVSVKPLKAEGEISDQYESYQNEMEQPGEDEKIMELPNYELEGATHEITGNLTMRGKTLAITVPAHIEVNDGEVKAFSNFSIDRTKWGLMYGDESKAVDRAKDKFIYNKVGIGFTVETQKPPM